MTKPKSQTKGTEAKARKESSFSKVDRGICPHDGETLANDVAVGGDPLKSLAERYLGRLMCPRTLRRSPGTRQQDLDNRFGYLRQFATEFNVSGAILCIIRLCDTFEYDAPGVKDYLEEAGIAVLHLEDDYSLSSIQGFRTRIEVFLFSANAISPRGGPENADTSLSGKH